MELPASLTGSSAEANATLANDPTGSKTIISEIDEQRAFSSGRPACHQEPTNVSILMSCLSTSNIASRLA